MHSEGKPENLHIITINTKNQTKKIYILDYLYINHSHVAIGVG